MQVEKQFQIMLYILNSLSGQSLGWCFLSSNRHQSINSYGLRNF